MKIRQGFVSNSSSSCFILDGRDSQVQDLVQQCRARLPEGFGRHTAMAIGQDAIDYVEELLDDAYPVELIDLVLKWAKKIGADNVVMMRESDEDMGGGLFTEEEQQTYFDNQIYVPHIESDQKEFEFVHQEKDAAFQPTIKNPLNPYVLLNKLTLAECEYH